MKISLKYLVLGGLIMGAQTNLKAIVLENASKEDAAFVLWSFNFEGSDYSQFPYIEKVQAGDKKVVNSDTVDKHFSELKLGKIKNGPGAITIKYSTSRLFMPNKKKLSLDEFNSEKIVITLKENFTLVAAGLEKEEE